jgi:hypothetical protein
MPTLRPEYDKLGTMRLRYFVEKHARKVMIVQTLQGGILKSNHLLLDELFKRKKTHAC